MFRPESLFGLELAKEIWGEETVSRSARTQAFREAIRIVQRFHPADKSNWEIRYWVVKEKLVKSLQRKLTTYGSR
jgi:hypothetical protein